MDQGALNLAENRRRMLAGELYYAGAPDLSEERNRCRNACWAFTLARYDGAPRRKLVELWKEYAELQTQLPTPFRLISIHN